MLVDLLIRRPGESAASNTPRPRRGPLRLAAGAALLGLITAAALAEVATIAPELAAKPVPDGTALSLRGQEPFHVTPHQVRAERVVPVADSDLRLLLWNEADARGRTAPFYAITLDGRHVAQVRETSYDIKLSHGPFDPAVERVPVETELAAGADTNVYLVQTYVPLLRKLRQQIEGYGGVIGRFVPNHTYIVAMTPQARAAVAALPYVRWVGPYHPAYRLEPGLRAALLRGELPAEGRYSIQVQDPEGWQTETLADRLVSAGGTIDTFDGEGSVFLATLTPAQLKLASRMDEVLYIDWAGEPVALMNNARAIGGANFIETTLGYTGQGVRGEVMDNGCQIDHPAYAARLTVRRAGPVESHGTSTVGINFGDGWSSANGRGLLPDAEGVFSYWGTTGQRVSDTGLLVNPPWECLYQSNSWGTVPETIDYNTASSELDEAVYRHDIVILQAMGNTGTRYATREAWAKNIVSVGGIRHYNTLTRADDQWAGAGAIGPAADGRIKPDLCHFYDSIRTTTTGSGYTSSFGGTSGATPIVAGHFGLFFQMWANGVFGNPVSGGSVFDERPHSSTARAVLINTATAYTFSGTSHDLTRTHQGWGMPDLQYLYDRRNNIHVVNETDVLPELGTATYECRIVAGQPYHDELRVTLVYTDWAGTPPASQHRINDLSLKVTSPSGTVYYGNNGLLAGNWSTPGGSRNTLDTVENVFVAAPEAGFWTIEVSADEINVDGHRETLALDADYALVITGGEYWEDCNGNSINDAQDIAGGTSADCNTNGTPDECELADNDCNGNLVPDECDIALGTSADCDANGLPDECQPDCNGNGVADACDLTGGTSSDCNTNTVPDECELGANDCNGNLVPDECDVVFGTSADCNTNGVPDECDIALGTSPDCNTNGQPDECDLASTVYDQSPPLTPLGAGYPQTFTMLAPKLAVGDVTLLFEAFGDLNFSSEKVDVYLNGVWVDEVFGAGIATADCPSPDPSADQSILTAAQWNAAAGTGTVAIQMVATSGVDPFYCQTDTWISVAVTYPPVATSQDANSNGVPDECETSPSWCLGDLDCSGGAPTFEDIKYFVSAIGSESVWRAYYASQHGGAEPPCPWLLGDYNRADGVEFNDIKPFASSIGQSCAAFAP